MNYYEHAPCQGPNCGITNTTQAHSKECQAELDAVSEVSEGVGLAGKSTLHTESKAIPLEDDNDFPLGKACDLSGEGTCESCQ